MGRGGVLILFCVCVLGLLFFLGGGGVEEIFFWRRGGGGKCGYACGYFTAQKKKLFYLALSHKQSIQLSNSSDVVNGAVKLN